MKLCYWCHTLICNTPSAGQSNDIRSGATGAFQSLQRHNITSAFLINWVLVIIEIHKVYTKLLTPFIIMQYYLKFDQHHCKTSASKTEQCNILEGRKEGISCRAFVLDCTKPTGSLGVP